MGRKRQRVKGEEANEIKWVIKGVAEKVG